MHSGRYSGLFRLYDSKWYQDMRKGKQFKTERFLMSPRKVNVSNDFTLPWPNQSKPNKNLSFGVRPLVTILIFLLLLASRLILRACLRNNLCLDERTNVPSPPTYVPIPKGGNCNGT